MEYSSSGLRFTMPEASFYKPVLTQPQIPLTPRDAAFRKPAKKKNTTQVIKVVEATSKITDSPNWVPHKVNNISNGTTKKTKKKKSGTKVGWTVGFCF